MMPSRSPRFMRRSTGVNFFDTADVYGDGASERLLARLRRERADAFHVATKAGRRLDPHIADGYTYANLARFIERSLVNLETDCLDLVQLHSPPSMCTTGPRSSVRSIELVDGGKVRYYGVSVEKVEEALKAIEFPGVQSVQIIFNMFRQRPADQFFAEAKRRQVGILARLPLAVRHVDGQAAQESTFATDDHRSYNRHGEASIGARRSRAWTTTWGSRGGRAASAGSRRDDAVAVRAALGPDVRCRDLRHPRRPTPRPGGGERRGGRPAAAPSRRSPRYRRCTTPDSQPTCTRDGDRFEFGMSFERQRCACVRNEVPVVHAEEPGNGRRHLVLINRRRIAPFAAAGRARPGDREPHVLGPVDVLAVIPPGVRPAPAAMVGGDDERRRAPVRRRSSSPPTMAAAAGLTPGGITARTSTGRRTCGSRSPGRARPAAANGAIRRRSIRTRWRRPLPGCSAWTTGTSFRTQAHR